MDNSTSGFENSFGVFVFDTASGSEIFQSIDASANSDGLEHFLSGSVDGGGALRVGVEDLTGLGDSDFQDFVFTVARTEDFDDPLAIA